MSVHGGLFEGFVQFFLVDGFRRNMFGYRRTIVGDIVGKCHNEYGPCSATNEHPRRAVDVILRQSKALIELFTSR